MLGLGFARPHQIPRDRNRVVTRRSLIREFDAFLIGDRVPVGFEYEIKKHGRRS
jgi:hypothetical protein